MTRDDFRNLLDAHGADPSRWPAELRESAVALIGSDAGARADLDTARELDAMLARFSAISAEDDESALRVMGKLNGPLPRQKQPFWRVPAALLDWQFAPAWPRMAALACCAGLGFAVGVAGIDRVTGPFAAGARGDLAAAVFEPEPLTGLRP